MGRKPSFGAVMAIYLVGLVIGALYVGMVAPVRLVIQAEFGIGNEEGIWIITIYALFYASFIPVIGKIADRRGRKPVFLACMSAFCIGSIVCGISAWANPQAGFITLLAGRVLQAIGACGIIPVANAEIGTAAPEDKRGFALGITSAATGISNVLGAAIGSGIIALVGQSNWPLLFFVCVPFSIAGIAAGIPILPKGEKHATGRIDVLGAASMIAFVFLLLLGIQFASGSMDAGSVQTTGGDIAATSIGESGGQAIANSMPWPASILAFAGSLIALIVLVISERRAKDPIFPPRYVKNSRILITLGVSFFIGGMINSMTIVPEFAEKALNMPLGSGGIYMALIGVFSMAGPPMGGKLIDKHGPKPVLLAGLAIAAVGYLLLATVTAHFPSIATMILGLGVMGAGLGFCMGTPVNYMILQNVPDSESNMAISTVTLVRQIGLSIAPAIYVAFISPGQGAPGYSAMFFAAAVFTVAAMSMMAGYRKKG